MLSAHRTPSPERLGTHIKGLMGASFDNDSRTGRSLATRVNLLSKSDLTAESYTPMHFDSERYAARFATPITPDPSLMKPVDMSQWTPSMSSPLITPTGEPQMEIISLATSEASWIRHSGIAEQNKEILRPSAKVFIPVGTPILKSNPQPRRAFKSGCHAETVMHEELERSGAPSFRRSVVNPPGETIVVSTTYVPLEVPKALTPLATPSSSAGLPPRPVACAVKPNLPRWAHSPKHTKPASSYSDNGHSLEFNQQSLIRRASPSVISRGAPPKEQKEQPDVRTASEDDFDRFDSGEMSSGMRSMKSRSMTPWAQHGKAGECKIGSHSLNEKTPAIPITSDLSHKMERLNLHAIGKTLNLRQIHVVDDVSPVMPFDANSWRRQPHKSVLNRTTKPSWTLSIPGGLLGAVPMRSFHAN